ncbi:MAG: RDD family protein [Blastocatellia bacterium]|nr:RDD family protein [Blastocatellia bacterium]
MQLDNELIIETPEHVQLRFALASVGTRFLAALIDHLLQLAGLIVASVLLYFISDLVKSFTGSYSKWVFAIWVTLVAGLILFVIGYFTVFETLWSGQTPGKRWMKLRVIRDDGRAISFFEAFVRNVLRVIDLLPSAYAVGVVTMVLSNESRRLGDYVAGTVVVKERASEAPTLFEVLEHHDHEIRTRTANAQSSLRLDVRQLTNDEITAVETFLIRRAELPAQTRPLTAARIAVPLMQKLAVPPMANYEWFLEEVDRQYKAKAKYLVD